MTQKRKSYARRGQNYEEDYFDLGIEEVLDLPRLTAEDDQALSEAEKIALKGSNFQTRAFKKILNGEVVMMIDDYTDAVYVIQHALIQLGYGHMLYDEYADHYGEGTAQAIFAFQFDHDALAPSGMVNAETLKVIDEKLSALETEAVTETEERIEANHERIDPDWEAKKAKWAKMGPAQIAKDRGLDWKQVKNIMRSDGSARVNGYIKELLMEGWMPEDGAPEVRTTRENGVMVIEAWTFSLAVQTAIANGLGWDKGDMFRWKQHRNAKTNQLIELYTQPRPLDVALNRARGFIVPFKGSLQEFITKHEGSFLVYQNNVSNQIPIRTVTVPGISQKKKPEDKVFTTLKTPIIGLVEIRKDDEEFQGVPLRKTPVSEAEVGDDEKRLETVKLDIITHLPFNTKVTILEECKAHGWYYVMTEKNDRGYVAMHHINDELPDFDYRYHVVEESQSMLDIVHLYYNPEGKKSLGQVEEDPLYRNYVLELARLNLEAAADRTSGVYMEGNASLNDKKNWEKVRVKKNFRIWIVDSGTMYNRLNLRAENEIYEYNGIKANVFSAAQTFLNATPQTMGIRAFLNWWEGIPEQDRIANMKSYGAEIVQRLKFFRNDSEIGGMIENALVLIPGATTILMIRRLLMSTVIGFFDALIKMDPKKLIQAIGASLRKLLDIQFYVGLARGIINGIIQWGEDLLNIFTDMSKLVTTLLSPEFRQQLSATAQKALDFVTQKKEKIMESFKEMSFVEIFASIMDGARSMVNALGEKLGGKLAFGTVNLMGKSPFGFGHGIGKIGGMLLPDIVISIVSGSVWAAVKGAVTASQTMMRILKPILKGIQVSKKMLQQGKNAVKKVLGMIRNMIGTIFKTVNSGAKRFWTELQLLFDDFLRFFSKKADDLPGKKKTGVDTEVDNYVAKNKKKYEEDFKGDNAIKKDGDGIDYESKKRDILWARGYSEMQDALQPSPEVASVVSFINMKLKWPVKNEISAKKIGKNTYLLSINPSWKYTVGMGQDVENIPGVDKAKLDQIADRFESKEEFLKFIDEFNDSPDLIKLFSDKPELVDAWKVLRDNKLLKKKNLSELVRRDPNHLELTNKIFDLNLDPNLSEVNKFVANINAGILKAGDKGRDVAKKINSGKYDDVEGFDELVKQIKVSNDIDPLLNNPVIPVKQALDKFDSFSDIPSSRKFFELNQEGVDVDFGIKDKFGNVDIGYQLKKVNKPNGIQKTIKQSNVDQIKNANVADKRFEIELLTGTHDDIINNIHVMNKINSAKLANKDVKFFIKVGEDIRQY